MFYGRHNNGIQSLAEQQAVFDEEDDVVQREAIATEEQNYYELS